MKIGFIFNMPFHIRSVAQQPNNVATSAVSFLAIELAKLGHNITVFSSTKDQSDAFNVRCRNVSIENNSLNLSSDLLETDYDVIIVKNDSPEFALTIKNSLPSKPKFFLWTAFDYNEPINNGLYNTEIVEQIDGIVCVSDWQSNRLRSKLQIPRVKLYVQHYAISPVYESLFASAKEYINAKDKAPSLAYTGKQTDGLDLLLDLYGDITNNYPDSTLTIYADLSSGDAQYTPDNFPPGIKNVWPIWGKDLASCLRRHTILAYPCLEEKTSHIDITEAMAAGLYVVTSRAGSLPEYCYGNGKQIAEQELHSDSLGGFTGQILSICQTQIRSQESFYDYCYKQILEINKKQTYKDRAGEWIEMLSKAITI